MNWNDVKPWISRIAPMVGTALGGPLGGAAGALLGQALGIKDASPESVQAAIDTGTLSGEQIAAMRESEQKFKALMAEMNIKSVKDLEDIAAGDRKDARAREIAVKDKTPAILAYAITVGFFGLLIMLLFKMIPETNKSVLDVMLGALGTAWIGCTGYYFGSTAGSKEKNALLYNSQPSEGKQG